MIEYKSLSKHDIIQLPDLGKEGWITSIVVDGIIILYRDVRRSREAKKVSHTPEWLEFQKSYPTKSGIYDDKLAAKYNKLVLEGIHKDILASLELYKKELEVTGKPTCNASTFINQKRWLQDFKVTKSKSDEWMNPLLADLPASVILTVKEVAKHWEADHPTKQMNEATLKNIILKYTSPPYK